LKIEREKESREKRHNLININVFCQHLPFAVPPLLLEALVDGLRYRGLHQVDVAHDERRENCLQLMVEATVLEVVCFFVGMRM
jgi:hypothetical protein